MLSDFALGISTQASATTLRSTEEVNTVATSYSTHEPSWTGGSGADVEVTGIYDGSVGDTTLTFEVTQVGILFIPNQIEVRDGNGALVDTLSFLDGQATGQHALSNGLSVHFTSSSFSNGDTFSIDVSNSTGSTVRTGAAFDGTLDAAPEFDPGLGVGAGSFQVNGTTITVAANDSIDAVLAKITASAADVNATFDAATESIVLERKSSGSANGITLSNDTSGFLDATKLTGATAVAGTDDERALPLDQVAAFAGVSTGNFLVNGVSISVDVAVDTIQDVLDRIGASVADAEAEFTSGDQRIVVRAKGSKTLSLDDGTSGFFSALGIDTGNFEATPGRSGVSIRDKGRFERALEDFVGQLGDLVRLQIGGTGAGTLSTTKKTLSAAMGRAFSKILGVSGDGDLRSKLGIDLVEPGGRARGSSLDVRPGSACGAIPAPCSSSLFATEEDDGVAGLVAEIDREVAEGLHERGGARRRHRREARPRGPDPRAPPVRRTGPSPRVNRPRAGRARARRRRFPRPRPRPPPRPRVDARARRASRRLRVRSAPPRPTRAPATLLCGRARRGSPPGTPSRARGGDRAGSSRPRPRRSARARSRRGPAHLRRRARATLLHRAARGARRVARATTRRSRERRRALRASTTSARTSSSPRLHSRRGSAAAHRRTSASPRPPSAPGRQFRPAVVATLDPLDVVHRRHPRGDPTPRARRERRDGANRPSRSQLRHEVREAFLRALPVARAQAARRRPQSDSRRDP
ncbi:MAG: hypothetical protein R3F34_07830 [Planctomycetota bacterium]